MSEAAAEINRVLETAAPVLYRALSPLGRRAVFPPDVPYQSVQARGTTYNGTIGILTDGHGGAIALPSMRQALQLSDADLSRAFLYSPIGGNQELRERWREWQRRGQPETVPSSLPLVTVGLSHGLSVCADLFGGEGRAVGIPTPFWGNYPQIFTMRTGAPVRTAPGYREGRFNPGAIAEALSDVEPGQPAVALINIPANPGGYAPTVEERAELRRSLLALADQRPLVVVLDEAYGWYVYEDDVPQTSLFWELAGVHEQLIPIKIDGATKDLSFFGGRVGFLTFAIAPDSPAIPALESKFMSLMRSTVGSPVASSQVLLLQALRSGGLEEEAAELRRIVRERYLVLKPLLAELDCELLCPLPFNAGFFALVEIPERHGISAEQLRRHLLAHHDTGIIAVPPRYLRIAICSVAPEAIPEMMARVVRGMEELAAGA